MAREVDGTDAAVPSSHAHRHLIERPGGPVPGVSRVLSDTGPTYLANGLIGVIFSATGPVAVILAVGAQGGLSQSQLASWLFGAFFLNGLLTVIACWVYRQPLAFFWTIPGTVLVGPALGHLTWPQVLSAFVVTGLLILILGLTGWVRRVMSVIPMPIVMAMVAGVFLRFGTDLVTAVHDDAPIAGPMMIAYIACSALPALGRWLPPLIAALAAGSVSMAVTERFTPGVSAGSWIASPVFESPDWSFQAMLELCVPLAITVLVVQNGQGVAILRAGGHAPPINTITIACGAWSLVTSTVGCVSTCLTGPTNALLSHSGERGRQYTAGIACGLLAMAVGLLAPMFTWVMLATPVSFIAALGGLAMLRVLQSAFVTAFSSMFTLGALVTFIVTVADVTVLDIGAAFWGLVAGLAVSWLLERDDFRRVRGAATG